MIVLRELFLQETLLDGKNEIYGEYLINAQGEDVVAGTRTPQYITKKARINAGVKESSMEEAMPDAKTKKYSAYFRKYFFKR